MSKKKWNGVLITEHNVDEYLSDLASTKGRHITQGVAFNKADPTQMNLLRLALIRHNSFSGLVKFLLYEYFKNQPVDFDVHPLDEDRLKYLISKQDREKKKAQRIREQQEQPPQVVNEDITFEVDSEEPVVELEPNEVGEIVPVKKNKHNNLIKLKQLWILFLYALDFSLPLSNVPLPS